MKSDVQNRISNIICTMNDNGLRVGQIMSNLFYEIAKDGTDPFYIEDSQLLERLEEYSKK